MDLGEERRLNEVDREVAGLKRRGGLPVSDHLRVLSETPENVIERRKFSIADHCLHPRRRCVLMMTMGPEKAFKATSCA
jgi:hypothetical protein